MQVSEDLETTQARELLDTMCTIRAFEEAVDDLFARGLLHGTMHLSIGQEATAAGAVAALEEGDYITSTHRGHGHCIAKGADLAKMLAELFGKETGYCRGRGGSMHIADVEAGNLGANGIVAGSIPIAAGAALALRMRGSDRVVLCFFGDGATNEGGFHEALNMAAIWKLPVVFLCENNCYGMSMAWNKATSVAKLSDRAAAYAIPGETVDGNDILAVRGAVSEAVRRARAGDGPTLLEAQTYRWKGHSKSDQNLYRTRDEISSWRERDPITRFAKTMIDEGSLTDEDAQAIASEARTRVADAVEISRSDPEPSISGIEDEAYA